MKNEERLEIGGSEGRINETSSVEGVEEEMFHPAMLELPIVRLQSIGYSMPSPEVLTTIWKAS